MSAYIPLAAALVEFGTGSTAKARILIDAAPQIAAYVPVDISGEFLAQEAAACGATFRNIAILPVVADFTRDFDLPPQIRAAPARRLLPRLDHREFRAGGRDRVPAPGRRASSGPARP